MLDGLLSDVGENGIGATEGDHRHLAEEDGNLGEHILGSKTDEQGANRDQPENEPNTRRPQRADYARPRMLRQFLAEQAIDHAVLVAASAMAALDLERTRTA